MPRRSTNLPDMPREVVREFRERERQDRSFHDNERTLVKARDGGSDLTLRASGNTVLTHARGKLPTGWRFLDITAAAGTVIGTMPYRTAWDANTITIRNDNPTALTVRLEVF